MNCRLCNQPLHPIRVELGHTGCCDCEQIHLWGQIAAGARTGVMPDWYINPDEWEAWDANRQASEAVRVGLQGPAYQGDCGGMDW